MIDSIIGILKAISLTPIDGIMIVVGTVLIFTFQTLLKNFVFNPLLVHVEQREALTAGALHTADQMRQKTEALKSRFDEAIFTARVEGNTKRAAIIDAAKESATKVIREAEEEAAREVQIGREKIAKQITSASAGAADIAKDLANRLASQVDSHLAA